MTIATPADPDLIGLDIARYDHYMVAVNAANDSVRLVRLAHDQSPFMVWCCCSWAFCICTFCSSFPARVLVV